MNQPPAFQFYPDDFVGGVADMSAKEIGHYIMLLCFQWSHGEIPDDARKQKLICRGKPSPNVLKKFPKTESKLINPRLEIERKKQQEYREERSKSGQLGADRRWHSHSSANSSAIVLPMANSMAKNSSPSPSPSPSPYSHTPKGNGSSPALISELQKRLGSIFHRKPDDNPPYEELHALAEIARRPNALSELGEIESFREKEQNYFPGSVVKIVTNWQSVLDRARTWKQKRTPQEEREFKNLMKLWS